MADETMGARSRWSPSTPLPSAIKRNSRNQRFGQLLQESAALVPNEAELMKQLSDKELSPVETQHFHGSLQAGMRDYLTNYRENPFYAFSREGINKVRELQLLVNDPKLKGMAEAYKSSQKEMDRIVEGGLSANVSLTSDGKLAVWDSQEQKRKFIRPESYDPKRHAPFKISDEFDFKRLHEGFGDMQPLKYDMNPLKDVQDKIFKYFGGLGTHGGEQLQDLVKITSKGNRAQIESRLRSLLSDTGLSGADKNTLLSQYYTNKLNRGEKISEAEAQRGILQSITDIANGYLTSDYGIDVNPEEKLRMEIAKEKTANTSVHELLWAQPSVRQTSQLNSKFSAIDVKPVPMGMMDTSANYRTDKDSGIKTPMKNIADMRANDIMKTVSPDWQIQTMDGPLINMREAIGEDVEPEMYMREANFVMLPVVNGRVVSPYSPEAKNATEFIRGMEATVEMAGNRNAFGEESRHSKLEEVMEQSGYQSMDVPQSRIDDYYNNVRNSEPGSMVGTNLYQFKVFSPFVGDEKLSRLAEDKNVLQPKVLTEVGTEGAKDVAKQSYQGQPVNSFIKNSSLKQFSNFDWLNQPQQ